MLGSGRHRRPGCLWALNHHVDRLTEKHANARILASGVAELPGITLDPSTVETNIEVFAAALRGSRPE